MSVTIKLKRGTTEPTSGSLVVGELAINSGDGNVYTKLDDGTVSNIVAKSQKLTSSVRNETGSTIGIFKAVYISGASSNKPLVSLAKADAEATSSKTFGVTTVSISNGTNGEVISVGLLDKVDTSAYVAGDQLWLSPTTAGGFTTTAPSAPNHAVFIGTVTYSHANNGKVEIRIQNGYELGELHNVSISSVADKDIISYDSASGLYKNKTATALGLAPLASPTFTGNVTAGTNLVSANSSGDEGGEILLAKPQTNTTLSGTGVTIDVYQNRLRFFEQGGSARGAYIDITATSGGVGTNLLSGGATNASWGSITGTLSSQTDLNNALSAKAPLASPTFTGTVTIPAGASISGFAPMASPTFTGTPSLPTGTTCVTQTAGDSTTKLATTAFVTTADNLKANLASPTFTGTPAAPTATTATNSTQIATTAYVKNNLASYATTSAVTSALASYTPTASLNNELIATDVTSIWTDYTLAVTDANSIIKIDTEGATSHTIYLPDDTTANLPIGSQVVFVQIDSYPAVFSATWAATMYCRGSRTTMNGQYAVATAVKVASNTWVLSGDLV